MKVYFHITFECCSRKLCLPAAYWTLNVDGTIATVSVLLRNSIETGFELIDTVSILTNFRFEN